MSKRWYLYTYSAFNQLDRLKLLDFFLYIGGILFALSLVGRGLLGCSTYMVLILIYVEVVMANVNLVTQTDFDEQTIEELKNLSRLRVSLIQKQLDSIDDTINQLVERDIIKLEDVAFHKNDLVQILQDKIDHLNNFIYNDNLYIDEVEFYLDLL